MQTTISIFTSRGRISFTVAVAERKIPGLSFGGALLCDANPWGLSVVTQLLDFPFAKVA